MRTRAMAQSGNDRALLDACKNGDAEKVRELLDAGADTGAQGDAGNTPPSLAARIGGFAGFVGFLAVYLVLIMYMASSAALTRNFNVLEDVRFGALCGKAMIERELEGVRPVLLNYCPPFQDDGSLRTGSGRLAVRLVTAADGGRREYSESQPSRAFVRGPSRTPARGRRGAAR